MNSRLDRNLAAFEWLPLHHWNVDRLFNDYLLPSGGRMCKICDEVVSNSKQEQHIKDHLAYENERRLRVKTEANPERVVRVAIKTDVRDKIVATLTDSEGLTLAAISQAINVDVNTVRATVKSMERDNSVIVAGKADNNGKRGRPACLYKIT